MDDKKVILSKSEFDKMEADLNDFAAIIESKTVCRIGIPRLTWSNMYEGRNISSYDVQYVIGSDENEIVKELGAEIEKLKDNNKTLNQIIDTSEANLRWIQNQQDDWKDLPWYKRLFV